MQLANSHEVQHWQGRFDPSTAIPPFWGVHNMLILISPLQENLKNEENSNYSSRRVITLRNGSADLSPDSTDMMQPALTDPLSANKDANDNTKSGTHTMLAPCFAFVCQRPSRPSPVRVRLAHHYCTSTRWINYQQPLPQKVLSGPRGLESGSETSFLKHFESVSWMLANLRMLFLRVAWSLC